MRDGRQRVWVGKPPFFDAAITESLLMSTPNWKTSKRQQGNKLVGAEGLFKKFNDL